MSLGDTIRGRPKITWKKDPGEGRGQENACTAGGWWWQQHRTEMG